MYMRKRICTGIVIFKYEESCINKTVFLQKYQYVLIFYVFLFYYTTIYIYIYYDHTHIYKYKMWHARERKRSFCFFLSPKYFVYNRISSVFVCLHFCCIYDILTHTTFHCRTQREIPSLLCYNISYFVCSNFMYVCMYVCIYI